MKKPVLTSFAWQESVGYFADSKAQYWIWRSMGASHSKFVYCFQSQRCVYFRALRELDHPLSVFGADLHPTIDWTPDITWYGPVHTPPFVESNWRWVLGIFCRSLAAWVRWPGFLPSQPPHIFPRVHMFVCDPPKPYYFSAKKVLLRNVFHHW